MRSAIATTAAAAVIAAGCGGGGEEPGGWTGGRPAAPAGPRGPWTIRSSPPVAAGELLAPRLALQPQGGGLVAVQGAAYGHADCRRRDRTGAFAARLDGHGDVGEPRALGGDLSAGPVPLLERRFAAVLSEPLARTTDCDPRSDLVLADLDADGVVTGRVPLARDVGQVWEAEMAASSDGDVVVAWIEVEGEATFRLRAVLRDRTGELTRPVTLARGGGVAPQLPAVDGVAVAMSAEAAALVAYAHDRTVKLVTLRPDGTVARRRRLGPALDQAEVAVAAGSGGRAAVAWGTQDGGEERNEPYVVRATAKRAGGERFPRPRVVDAGGALENPPGGLALRLAADGRALLAWDQVRAYDHPVTRYADAPAEGSFGRGRPLLDRARLGGLAVAEDGSAAVALIRGARLSVRRRSAHGTAFTAPAEPTDEAVYATDAAFDPGGPLLLAWSRVPEHGRPALAVAVSQR